VNIKNLYDTITLRVNCSHNTFLTHLDLTVRSLISRYKESYVIENSEVYITPKSINDDIPVFEEYYSSIISNIFFLLSGDVNYKSEFLSESDAAYKAVWSHKANGKKIRARG
jgi:hypothetical protein